jgi:chromate reductase
VEIGDLPLYNQDNDENQGDAVLRLKAEIAAAQGLLFITPEYNRSIPGVLKNAIDHASRPYGRAFGRASLPGCWAPRSEPSARPWRNSICATFWPIWMCGRSLSRKRSSMPGTGVFDDADNFAESSGKFLQNWMDRYVAWIKQHAA